MKYLHINKHIFAAIFVVLALLNSNHTFAQFQEIEVGINGLTCSMCSYSVENSIKKLPYVSTIKMDLNNNIAQVISNSGESINFKEVADRVKKSGFSVRFISFKLPTEVDLDEEGLFKLNEQAFYIIDFDETILQAGTSLKLVGKDYLPKSDLKKQLAKFSNTQRKALKEEKALFVIHEN